MELRDRMATESNSRAEIARRMGVSRALVTQWLDLLGLPEKLIQEAEALGDNWDRQVVTERELRGSRIEKDPGRAT
jgi:ParB-like chromosome segregation protein Spo0J